MKLEMDNIDIYNNSAFIFNEEQPKMVKYWFILLIVLTILFSFIIFIPYNKYNKYEGYITNNYLYIKLNKKDFPIYKNKKICINDECYKYKVQSIEKDVVLLDLKIKEEINIDNNTLIVDILKDRTNIFMSIKNKIKKGLIL